MIKYKNILIVLTIFILVLFIISNTVLGTETLVDIFKNSMDTEGSGATDLKNEGGQIVGLIQIIGTIVSVGMLIILGIKYVLGSAEQKAEYRKTMLPYFIGTVLIFGFSNITQWIYEWSKQI